MRTAFINQLIEEASKNDKVFLLVGDLGFSVVEPYAERFPNRYLNVGIAEQNMAGMAAGLAMEGYRVYIYSIGNFPTLRCMEQIRYDICYHNLNVTVVAVGGGYAYGSLGASHHATEELAMLRAIPNMVVCAPGDPEEAKLITTFTAQHDGPCYIRLGKAGEPVVHAPGTITIELGKILKVKGNKRIAVFSTGSMLKYVVDYLDQNNIDSSVYSFPFIKPIDKTQLAALFNKYDKIITIEEHQSNGGFGSAILEYLNDLTGDGYVENPPAIKRIAIQDKFYSVAGSQDYLREIAGLTLLRDYFN
jgi:transketolase